MTQASPSRRAVSHSTSSPAARKVVPLGAALLLGSLGTSALAQTTPSDDATLPTVEVRETALTPEGKDTLRATTAHIGKGKQKLRDIPQSVTVVTEKLIDDRQLDTVKEALKNTAGVTFQAGETGEEDIRLRGFSLAASGDIFVDGMRDPAFYDRDTFNMDQVEVLRGSASMLFGRGSTGGAVNQVNKLPRLIDENEVSATIGSGSRVRVTGDFNKQTGENQALRVNVMGDRASKNGIGAKESKKGIAAAYRWGIGTQDEFMVNLFHLDNRNGINYGLPYLLPANPSGPSERKLLPVDPKNNYAMASDRTHSKATLLGLSHTHRFDDGGELTTRLRKGRFERDIRSSAIGFADRSTNENTFSNASALVRRPKFKIQDVDTLHAQSDYTNKFRTGSIEHTITTGVDFGREEKDVYAPLSTGSKPGTTIGTPADGAWINEDGRPLYHSSHYRSNAFGAYVQDVAQVAPHWKLVGGLRYDNLKGDYETYTAAGQTSRYQMKVSEWSHRLGVLYQPTENQSYHLSYGTSFNTSGDTYSLNASNAGIDPEKSRNIELGARFDSPNKQFSTRVALFHSTKYNERNTDPDLPVANLSGQRHTAGLELDFTGRITPKWEIYASYMYLPVAKVDKAAPCPATGSCSQNQPGERVGERPGLTPKHSGTVWTTYQFHPKWRAGAGVNFRSSQKPVLSDIKVPGYATYDLMAEYRHSDTLSFKANVSNLTNKHHASELYRGFYVPGAGRSYALTATLKF